MKWIIFEFTYFESYLLTKSDFNTKNIISFNYFLLKFKKNLKNIFFYTKINIKRENCKKVIHLCECVSAWVASLILLYSWWETKKDIY